MRNAAAFDDYIETIVVERLSRPDSIDLLRTDQQERTSSRYAELAAARQRLQDLADEYARPDSPLSIGQLRDATTTLQTRIAELEQKIADSYRGHALHDVVGAADMKHRWANLDLSRRRAIVNLLIRVTVQPTGRKGRPAGWQRGRTYFDHESIRVEWLH